LEGGVYFYLLKKSLEFNRKNIVTCKGKSILLFTRYIQTTQSSVKSIRKCKKNPYIINQTIFFSKIIMKSFLDRFLTNVTPKHSELSIFWLFIYSLCSHEWFLFVHNLNTTNKNWLWFSYIFKLKINPKN
jgi:hypothetical protein